MRCGKWLVLFSLLAMNAVDEPAPLVLLAQGRLAGRAAGAGAYFEYLGVPYATSDASTRFKAAGPPPTWDGVFHATTTTWCPQVVFGRVVGSEACLTANVYVPARAPPAHPRAVMVFIHGGAFMMGSGGKFLYGPKFFMDKDVILVTFNYRLGALGFTCLGIKEAPGNIGLKDQIAALRWVKKNIAAFGGDPDNVTLFGESAGATSAALLLASPATDGLFEKVIMQSGSSISSWSINRKPVWKASLMAKKLGFESEDPHELYEFFMKSDYRDLVAVPPGIPEGLFFDTQLLHLPCVENEIPGEEAVLPDLPYNLLLRRVKNIPVIHGTNSAEGLFLSSSKDGSVAERNGKYILASDLRFSSVEEGLAVSRRAQQFYFGEEPMSLARVDNITELYTQLYFEAPAIMETELILERSAAPVYNYVFDYLGGRNFVKLISGQRARAGACHADDLFYMFDSLLTPLPLRADDAAVVRLLTSMWSDFAKTGDPTPAGAAGTAGVVWVPSARHQLRFLYISNTPRLGPTPNAAAAAMWRDIYRRHRNTSLKRPSIGPVE